jgi:hypothetical protein
MPWVGLALKLSNDIGSGAEELESVHGEYCEMPGTLADVEVGLLWPAGAVSQSVPHRCARKFPSTPVASVAVQVNVKVLVGFDVANPDDVNIQKRSTTWPPALSPPPFILVTPLGYGVLSDAVAYVDTSKVPVGPPAVVMLKVKGMQSAASEVRPKGYT